MDMTGLKTVKAGNLKPGDIICDGEWTNDLKVLDVIKYDSFVAVKTIGICEDIHGKSLKEHSCDDSFIILNTELRQIN